VTFCGNPIGRSGNKMCLQKDCEVASYVERALPTCFPDNDMVIIVKPF